jgi:hypothetical protein
MLVLFPSSYGDLAVCRCTHRIRSVDRYETQEAQLSEGLVVPNLQTAKQPRPGSVAPEAQQGRNWLAGDCWAERKGSLRAERLQSVSRLA